MHTNKAQQLPTQHAHRYKTVCHLAWILQEILIPADATLNHSGYLH